MFYAGDQLSITTETCRLRLELQKYYKYKCIFLSIFRECVRLLSPLLVTDYSH